MNPTTETQNINPTPTEAPTLDKPGAGIPFFERMMAKYFLLKPGAKKMPWEKSNAHFLRETEKITTLAKSLSQDQLIKPVLIPRIRGIEDSSRYWSVAMTLEHLIIVATGMADIIVELGQARAPSVVIDTAKVKPENIFEPEEAIPQFEAAMKRVHQRVNTEVRDQHSPAKLIHPWFGPLSAREWNWLLTGHQSIHRKQIEEIIKGLGTA